MSEDFTGDEVTALSQDEYTPTTDQVRNAYGWSPHDNFQTATRRAAESAFDRWLAARDREVAARALEDAAHFADRMYAGSDGTDADRAWISGVTAVAINLRRLATEVRKGDA